MPMYNVRVNNGENIISTEPELQLMIKAAAMLNGIPKCENVLEGLREKIQDAFQGVPVTNCRKELDGAVYQPNGLVFCGNIKATYLNRQFVEIAPYAVVCAPWELPTGSDAKKPERKKNITYNGIRGRATSAWMQLRAKQKLSYSGGIYRYGFNSSVASFLKAMEQTSDLMSRLDSEGQNPFANAISLSTIATNIDSLTMFLTEFLYEWCLTDKGVDAIHDTCFARLDTGGLYDYELLDMMKLYKQPFVPKGKFGLHSSYGQTNLSLFQMAPNLLDALEFLQNYDGSKYMRYALEKLKVVSKSYRPDREKIMRLFDRACAELAKQESTEKSSK